VISDSVAKNVDRSGRRGRFGDVSSWPFSVLCSTIKRGRQALALKSVPKPNDYTTWMLLDRCENKMHPTDVNERVTFI
jgi:hypothetical protein